MMFLRAHLLWMLIAVPAIWLAYYYRDRRVARVMATYGDLGMVRSMASSLDHRKRATKRILILTAVALTAIAASGPSWGYGWEKAIDNGVDVMVAVDVSKSMLATDLKPSRLEAAKLAIQDLVTELRGERIGLIAFSGTSFVQCPLTSDYSAFLTSLSSLSVDTIPRGGTNISAAIESAVKSLGTGDGRSKAIFILTDGENHEGDPEAAARAAASESISVYTIGLGSVDGELIPIVDERGRTTFLKDNQGNVVKTSLQEEILKAVARAGNGEYFHATQLDMGLTKLYNSKLASVAVEVTESGVRRRPIDRYQIPLIASVILLFAELLISERRGRQWNNP